MAGRTRRANCKTQARMRGRMFTSTLQIDAQEQPRSRARPRCSMRNRESTPSILHVRPKSIQFFSQTPVFCLHIADLLLRMFEDARELVFAELAQCACVRPLVKTSGHRALIRCRQIQTTCAGGLLGNQQRKTVLQPEVTVFHVTSAPRISAEAQRQNAARSAHEPCCIRVRGPTRHSALQRPQHAAPTCRLGRQNSRRSG